MIIFLWKKNSLSDCAFAILSLAATKETNVRIRGRGISKIRARYYTYNGNKK